MYILHMYTTGIYSQLIPRWPFSVTPVFTGEDKTKRTRRRHYRAKTKQTRRQTRNRPKPGTKNRPNRETVIARISEIRRRRASSTRWNRRMQKPSRKPEKRSSPDPLRWQIRNLQPNFPFLQMRKQKHPSVPPKRKMTEKTARWGRNDRWVQGADGKIKIMRASPCQKVTRVCQRPSFRKRRVDTIAAR